MTRFRKVLFIGLVCFLTIGVSYLYAGEIPLPEGYVADGKPISATMTIIQVDETDAYQGTVILVFGTCKKVPFYYLKYRGGLVFNDLAESDFFDENGNPVFFEPGVLLECEPPFDSQGYAITGFSSWMKNAEDGVIIAECILEPVVPPKKPLQ
jgi:hypothetical protein